MTTPAPTLDEPEIQNNLIATGALHTLLQNAQYANPALTNVDVQINDRGQPTNALIVRFEFLNSPYRLTVQRITDAG